MTPPTTGSTVIPESRVEYRRVQVEQVHLEQRADDDAPRAIVGHAAVFDREYPIGPPEAPYWMERVARGAFLDSLAEDDVRALFNHNENIVLGRNRAGTLVLAEDEVGLSVRIVPDLENNQVRDVFRMIERGDVSQMSIGFIVRSQQWDIRADGVELRTIQRARLFDVSPVTYPASSATDVAVRSGGMDPQQLLAEVHAERAKRDAPTADALRRRLQMHDALVTATL